MRVSSCKLFPWYKKLSFLLCSWFEITVFFSHHSHSSFQVSDIDHIERWISCMYMALPIFMVSLNILKSMMRYFMLVNINIVIWITWSAERRISKQVPQLLRQANCSSIWEGNHFHLCFVLSNSHEEVQKAFPWNSMAAGQSIASFYFYWFSIFMLNKECFNLCLACLVLLQNHYEVDSFCLTLHSLYLLYCCLCRHSSSEWFPGCSYQIY
jgi:hypothetical protein